MGSRDQGSRGGQEAGPRAVEGEPPTAPTEGLDASTDDLAHPRQSPLYYAQHADRYQRQELISAYEARTKAKLVVALDVIDIDFVQNLEEHLVREVGDQELHLLLRSPGGDGEQAVRAVRALQKRCSKLVVVVPDVAKSAATILTLGADEIWLGPTSDLGPIDPQMQIGKSWHAAKSIITAVEQAEEAVSDDRDLTPLWASLLADVTALDFQAAKSELDRTASMVKQAISYRTNPPLGEDLDDLVERLVTDLQDTPESHATTLGPSELDAMGLPIVELEPTSWEWECIWRLWILYWVQVGGPIYESSYGSFRPGGPHPS